MRGIGTIVNVLAVFAGGGIGLIFRGGLKARFQEIIMQALGLAVIFIGAAGALKGIFVITGETLETAGTMAMILSLVIGSVVGEWINVEDKMEQFGAWLKNKAKGKDDPKFVEGFVTATLVICTGAMAVVGSIQDGLSGDPSMLFAKAMLDAVIVLVFASTLGKGVLFSAIPLGIFQGSITLFAKVIEPILTEQMIGNLSFIGSMLIFCVGVNLAFGKKFRVGNMLPALLVAIAYCFIEAKL
jgi:uncharacterized membrane protein YqgA involved in biofilm formation